MKVCKVCKFEYKKGLCPVCNIIVKDGTWCNGFNEPVGKDLTLEDNQK